MLTVREELIATNRPMVQDLVDHVLGAGLWLDQQPANRDKAVAIAAGKYFNQDPNIIRFVMENPTDRVTYGDLRMIREEFEELMQLSIEAGTIKHPIPYEKYMDESFARAPRPRSSRCERARDAARARCSRCCSLRGGGADGRCAGAQGRRLRAAAPGARASRCSGSDGSELELRAIRGKVVLLAFGFTHCAGRVPDHARDAGAGARASSAPRRSDVQVVYVTVDPERDDAARMKQVPAALRSDLHRRHRHAAQLAAVRKTTASSPRRCRWAAATRSPTPRRST